MKKQILLYFMAASVAATAGVAQPRKSVSDVVSLSDSFQSAVDSTDALFSILKAAYSEAKSLNSSAHRLVSDARLLSYKTERAKFEFERLKSDFSKSEAVAALFAADLSASLKTPITPNPKIAEIIEKTNLAVLGNPGDNYQDQRYFEGVKSAYDSACSQLVSAQSEALKASANAAVVKAVAEGVNDTLAMCRKNLESYAALVPENLAKAEKLDVRTAELLEKFISKYEDFSEIYGLYSRTRTASLAALFALVESKTGSDEVLENGDFVLPELFVQSEMRSASAALCREDSETAAIKAQLPVSDLVKLQVRRGGNYADSAGLRKNNSASQAAREQNYEKRIRQEVLLACAKIKAATSQIKAVAAVLRQQTAAVVSASDEVAQYGGKASDLLSRTIANIAATQQRLSSNILMAEIGYKTQLSQNAIADKNIAELSEKAKAQYAAASGFAKKILAEAGK